MADTTMDQAMVDLVDRQAAVDHRAISTTKFHSNKIRAQGPVFLSKIIRSLQAVFRHFFVQGSARQTQFIHHLGN
jgi:nucleosome binding factor SPN SPT16 subunit